MQTRENINVKTINVDKKKFFLSWLTLLKPYHKLRNKQMEFLSVILYKRYELGKKVKDEDLLNKLLFDTDTRKEIQEEMKYSSGQVLSNMIYSLKVSKVLSENNIIHPGLIPVLSEDGDNFKLVFNFNINGEN